jgi:hypothetical protein
MAEPINPVDKERGFPVPIVAEVVGSEGGEVGRW